MKIVIALGGNALGDTPEQQAEMTRLAAKTIVRLIEDGNQLVLAHGNGPQVGLINAAMEASAQADPPTPEMAFPECGAMSQGYIGYHLQRAIGEELARKGIDKTVCTIVTQVLVDAADPAFKSPTKPIGRFFPVAEMEKLEREKGWVMKDLGAKGCRRVVASPKPVDIIEKQAIGFLRDNGYIVIACGGGGIPVVREGDRIEGVDAVIDKDYASAMMAQQTDADCLMILTDVDNAFIDYGKDTQKALTNVGIAEIEQYVAGGQFGAGSMSPKVEAALGFAKSRPGRRAIIANLNNADKAARGESGTIIQN